MIKNFIRNFYKRTIFFILAFLILLSCDQPQTKNNKVSDKIVVIKVFSSLTCPHCANFHQEVILKLKKEYIDTNRVKFFQHLMQLNLAGIHDAQILFDLYQYILFLI